MLEPKITPLKRQPESAPINTIETNRNKVDYKIPTTLSNFTEYLTPQSFVVKEGTISQETISDGYDRCDHNYYISEDEKVRFFEKGECEIDCGEFGKVKISAKTKDEERFFLCEFLDESVKITDYNDKIHLAILSHSGNDYILELRLTKNLIDENIQLSLNLHDKDTNADADSKPQQFTVCTKDTIFQANTPQTWNPYLKN